MKKLVVAIFLVASTFVLGAALKCHSQKYYLAKAKLEKMVLTPAQNEEIKTFAAGFQKKWDATHRKLGCSHHEDHAEEFIAAAAGVLTDDQFKSFRGRTRTDMEAVGYRVRDTRLYVENLIKICNAL
jgi:hypothetical protein